MKQVSAWGCAGNANQVINCLTGNLPNKFAFEHATPCSIHNSFKKMAAQQTHNKQGVASRTATQTKTTSTACAKNQKPRPRLPATDPKQIENLWSQVRKRNLGNMPPSKIPQGYMAVTRVSANKNKKTTESSATPSTTLNSKTGTLSAIPTSLTSKSQALTIKHPKFREVGLEPRGIVIAPKDMALFYEDPDSHFKNETPSKDSALGKIGKSTLWLDSKPEFVEKIRKEYVFMNHYNLCEAEYASFAKENLLKREPREEIEDNIGDLSQRFRRAERMLEFICKPDESLNWIAPPVLDGRNLPIYHFDIRPDCAYWLSLHGFSSRYSEQIREFVHVPQYRMTCPYFTIEFKRDDTDIKQAENQVATFGALALYNRYILHQEIPKDEEHKQTSQLTHYALTITKSLYTFWCIRPTTEGGKWKGCKMQKAFSGLLEKKGSVENFVAWINAIHRWGLTEYFESCERDIKALAEKNHLRVSISGQDQEERTSPRSSDAASTNDVVVPKPHDPASAPAGTEATTATTT